MPRSTVALFTLVLLCAVLGATGCGVQDQLLGTRGGLLFQGFDTLAHPGRPVRVTAELRGGNYLSGMEGYLVGFYDLDHKIGEMRTDEDGRAWVEITPFRPGQQVLTARLEDPDVRKFAVEATEILVEVQPPDVELVVLDLDWTLVSGGFEGVLGGQAEPIPYSLKVTERLVQDCVVVYLTGRPTSFSQLSKHWLRKNNYPLGPVIANSDSTLGLGVQQYKTSQIKAIKRDFPNLRYGVGDLMTDIRAYQAGGMHAILILHPDSMTEPGDVLRWLRDVRSLGDDVSVVENWRQVEQVIYEQAKFPASQAASELEKLARQRMDEILEQEPEQGEEPPAPQEVERLRRQDPQLPGSPTEGR